MDAVLPLQEAIGIFAFDHDVGGFQAGLIALQVIQNFISEPVPLCPAGVHAVEHLAPVLCFGAACTGVEAHQRIVFVVMSGKQSLQAADLHLLSQHLIAVLELLQHGVVVLLGSHFADGHQIVPGSAHLLITGNFRLGLASFHGDLLALFRVIPEAGCLLHGMEPLQLVAQTFHIQGICQAIQRGAAVIELLLIGIKGNIHGILSLLIWGIPLHI